MMSTAIARAREAGIAISVATTDAGGHLILLEGRMRRIEPADRVTRSAGAAAGYGSRDRP